MWLRRRSRALKGEYGKRTELAVANVSHSTHWLLWNFLQRQPGVESKASNMLDLRSGRLPLNWEQLKKKKNHIDTTHLSIW